MTDSIHPAAARVLAIPTLGGETPATREDGALVREYLRNVKRLADALGSWEGGPFFAPERLFGRGLGPERQRVVDDVVTWIAQPNADVTAICLASVRWAGYADEGEPLAVAHASLFDPLLRLFERGVELRIDRGAALIRGSALPLGAWRE
jgi:hypothetical protein